MAMATAIAREIKENELGDGFKRLWAGPVRECINPGCEISTRSESGECAVCTVIRRAEERVARGEVHDLIFNVPQPRQSWGGGLCKQIKN